MKAASTLLTLGFSLAIFGTVYAQPMDIMPLEGIITDSHGTPIDGDVTLTFRAYDAAESTNPIWSEVHEPVAVFNGHYVVYLGMNEPLAAFFDGNAAYLGVSVNSDPEGRPRIKIGSTPYAVNADDAQYFRGLTPAEFIRKEEAIRDYVSKIDLDARGYITAEGATAAAEAAIAASTMIAANTAKIGITIEQANAIAANSDKVGISQVQADAIHVNTAKVGISEAQADAIQANSAKVGLSQVQADAIDANTAKVGINAVQAEAIAVNSAKVGVTDAQATAIDSIGDNTSAIAENAVAIGNNSTQIISNNAAIALNTAKVGITAAQAAAITANTAKARQLYGEDANGNGQLDEGEDANNNGQLDGPLYDEVYLTQADAADIYLTREAFENGGEGEVDLSAYYTMDQTVSQIGLAVDRLETGVIANQATAIENNTNDINSLNLTVNDLSTDTASNATSIAEQIIAIGNHTTAIGDNTTAIGANATAIGETAIAIGNNATAISDNATAIGETAIAIGNNARAIGETASAIDDNAIAIGNSAIAIGKNTTDLAALVNRIETLEATIASLQSQGRALPFILGYSNASTAGAINVNGKQGLAGANEMCRSTFAGETGAHLCGYEEAFQAVAEQNYTAGFTDGTATWTLGRQNPGTLQLNCQGLLYNSGDIARGSTLEVKFNYQPKPDRANEGDIVFITESVACSTSLPVLCCR